MPQVVGVKFRTNPKVYFFSPNDIAFNEGDGVIIETTRGVEYGEITQSNHEVDVKAIVGQLKSVIRKASTEDTKQFQRNLERKGEAMKIAEEKISKNALDMKLIDVEFTFDNSKVIFYFTAEGRVDFRELVKDLASIFRLRIELRQVGIRDEAKILGGLGPCGRACCCSTFLPDFERVSIKMAKTQGLSLNPAKISGLCGRLMCCLKYENDHYAESAKMMPRLNSEVDTPDGKGIVASNDMLKHIVKVMFVKEGIATEFIDYPLDKVKFNRPIINDNDDSKDLISEDIKDLIDKD